MDAAGFALSLLAEAEAYGATLLLHHQVIALEPGPGGWRVTARPGVDGPVQSIECEAVINAAGLDSDRLAAMAGMDLDARGYRLRPCKGDYFSLDPASGLRVEHLVYPAPLASTAPGAGGLGVHATPDRAGGVRFGPDAEYVSEPDFAVDPAKAEVFAAAIRRYLPGVRAEWLRPDFAGIRPKLAGPGEAFRDFVVREESGAGSPGLVNCIGIESPGLTAALAIGERVEALLAGARV